MGRESNEEADMLANIGSRKDKVPDGVFLECITQRSIKLKQPHEPSTSTSSSPDSPAKDQETPGMQPIELLLIEPTWTILF